MSDIIEQKKQELEAAKKQDKNASVYRAYTERKNLRTEVWNVMAKNEHHYMTDTGDFDRSKVETLMGEKLAKNGYMPTEQDFKIVCAETIKTIDANTDFSVPLKCDMPPSQWIRELRDRAYFIPANDIPLFVQWAYEVVMDIQHTCRTGKVAKFINGRKRLHLIINSNTKNTGKSYLLESIINGAMKLGIAADKDVSLPMGGFNNTKAESKNLILSYSEPKDYKADIDMATVKCIGRRESYRYEAKGIMSVPLQSRAITMGTTNGNSYAPDDTTHLEVGTIPYSWSQFPVEMRQRVLDLGLVYEHFFLLDSEDSNQSVDSINSKVLTSLSNLLEVLPEVDERELLESEKIKREQIRWVVNQPGAIDAVRAISENKMVIISESKGISPAYLTSIASSIFNNDNAILDMENFLEACVSKKILKSKTYSNNGKKRPKDRTWYYQYNIKDSVLMDITLDDFTPGKFEDNDDRLAKAQEMWEKVFAIFDAIPPKDPKPEQTQEDDDIAAMLAEMEADIDIYDLERDRETYDYIDESPASYANTMLTLPTNHADDPYEIVNAIKEGKPRADDNVVSMRNFLFEIDGEYETEEERLALFQQQLAMLQPLVEKHIVNRMVYSGGKSIHARITVANEIKDKKEYKLVWHYLNNLYFDGMADKQCTNPSRFTRRIGGINEKTGRRQIGANCGNWVVDIGDMLKEWEIMDAKNDAQRRFIRAMERDLGNSYERKATIRATVETWRDSETKASIIRCLDGVGSYEDDLFRALGAIKWMGFTYDEVCDEIEFGSWNIRREFYDSLSTDSE